MKYLINVYTGQLNYHYDNTEDIYYDNVLYASKIVTRFEIRTILEKCYLNHFLKIKDYECECSNCEYECMKNNNSLITDKMLHNYIKYDFLDDRNHMYYGIKKDAIKMIEIYDLDNNLISEWNFELNVVKEYYRDDIPFKKITYSKYYNNICDIKNMMNDIDLFDKFINYKKYSKLNKIDLLYLKKVDLLYLNKIDYKIDINEDLMNYVLKFV